MHPLHEIPKPQTPKPNPGPRSWGRGRRAPRMEPAVVGECLAESPRLSGPAPAPEALRRHGREALRVEEGAKRAFAGAGVCRALGPFPGPLCSELCGLVLGWSAWDVDTKELWVTLIEAGAAEGAKPLRTYIAAFLLVTASAACKGCMSVY